MAKWTYDEALRRLLQHEGGYSNHPSDPGGPTNWGITIHDARKYWKPNATAEDVRNMPVSVAKDIYWQRYTLPQRYPDNLAGVDYAVFDYGVNSGIGRSGKVLRRVLGLPADTHVVTQEVIDAVKKRDPKAIVKAICDERLRFLQSLSTWPTFGAGWGRRVREVLAAATAMAGRQPQPVPVEIPVQPAPGAGQVPEPKAAKEAIRTGAPTAATAGGVTWWDWVQAHPVETALIAIAILGLIAFGLHKLKQWHKNKQETPMPDTPVVPELPEPAPAAA